MIRTDNKKGFTLIEIIITMAILGGIALMIIIFGLDMSELGFSTQDRLQGQSELQLTLFTMANEFRSMSPSDNGSYNIAVADTDTLTFYADIDDDGDHEQIRYFLTGTTLQKGITQPTGLPVTYPLANEVISNVVHDVANGANPIFTYFDKDYIGTQPAMASPIVIPNIRVISASVTVDRNANEPPEPYTLSIVITIRNLRDNLSY